MMEYPSQIVARITAEHFGRFQAFVKELKSIKDLQVASSIPLSYPSDDGKGMVVFPNVIFDYNFMKKQKKFDLTMLRIPSLIAPGTFTMWSQDIKHPHKAKRWERPDSTLNKKEVTTYARFIRNGLGIELPADKLRDIGTKLEVKFKPPHILFCKTPEDHVICFATRAMGSCCRPGSTYFGPIYQDALDMGRSPGEWYNHNPQTQAVCLMKNGRSVARAILVRDDDKKPFKRYCTLYGETMPDTDILKKELERLGYAYGGGVRLNTKFEIPAIEIHGKYYCPMISHDAVTYDYYMRWVTDKKVWEFAPSDGRVGGYGYNRPANAKYPANEGWVHIGGTHTSYTYNFFPEASSYTGRPQQLNELIESYKREHGLKQWTIKPKYRNG